MLLSVIVPLYNYERYISRCIDSLLDQGLAPNDYEIVVVNDGSTDNSASVVEGYMQRYPNVRLVNKANAGLGQARNTGIEHAKGDYIAFIDSDDRLVPGSAGAIFREIEEGRPGYRADIINFKMVFQQGDKDVVPRNSGDDCLEFTGSMKEYVERYGFSPTCQNCFYRREFLQDKRFTSIRYAEDFEFTLLSYRDTEAEVARVTNKAYVYMRHKGAMTSSVSKERIVGILDAFKSLRTKALQGGYLKDYDSRMVGEYLQRFIHYEATVRLMYPGFSYREIKKHLSDLSSLGMCDFRYPMGRAVSLVKWLSNRPAAMYLFSKPYRHIYLRFLKK